MLSTSRKKWGGKLPKQHTRQYTMGVDFLARFTEQVDVSSRIRSPEHTYSGFRTLNHDRSASIRARLIDPLEEASEPDRLAPERSGGIIIEVMFCSQRN